MGPWYQGANVRLDQGALATVVPRCLGGVAMNLVALVSQKGGGGKTTVATNLAVAAAAAGVHTILLDLDPQQSAFVWGTWRGQGRAKSGAPLEVQFSDCVSLPARLQAARSRGVGFVVIDTPPAKGPESDAAARLADIVLVVVQPSIMDLVTLSETHALGGVASRPAFVVFNRVPAGVGMLRDARERVREAGFRVAPVALSDRAIYRAAPIDGLGAQESERGERKAAGEVDALYRWVLWELNRAPALSAANVDDGFLLGANNE